MESTLLNVTTKRRDSITLTFSHLDPKDTYSVKLEEDSNKVWRVKYVKNGQLLEVIGKVIKIIPYEEVVTNSWYETLYSGESLESKPTKYKIKFDASDDFESKQVIVEAVDIRSIKPLEYEPEGGKPHDIHKPILVPEEAFNFIQKIYPNKYDEIDMIPNPLLTDKTINASSMFNGCKALRRIKPMNTRRMTCTSGMFYDCNMLDDLPMMELYRVNNMEGMFAKCYSLHTIPAFDTRNVRTFSRTFADCTGLIRVPELDMSSAIYTEDMFKGCSALEDVSFKKGSLHVGLDLSDCNLTKEVILNIIKNLGKPLGGKPRTIVFDNISQDQIDNIDQYRYVFSPEEHENYILPAMREGWIFRGITWETITEDMLQTDFSYYMQETYPMTYRDMTSVVLPNTSQATTMQEMFAGCLRLAVIPDSIDTSNVINMSGWASNCVRLLTVPDINTEKVTNMSNMFYGANSLLCAPTTVTSKVTSFKGTFGNCLSLTTVPEIDFSSCVDASGMFNRCTSLEGLSVKPESLHCSLDLSNTKLTKNSIINVLQGCGDINYGNELSFVGVEAAKTFNKNEWDTYVVPAIEKGWTISGILEPVEAPITNFAYYMKNNYPEEYMKFETCPELPVTDSGVYTTGMFEGCERLISTPNMYFPKLINADRMFFGCTSLLNIYDMTETKELTSTASMFYGCVKLLKAPSVETSKVINFRDMFNSCQMLTSIPEIDMSSAQYTRGMLDGCTSLREMEIKPNTLHVSLDFRQTNISKASLLNIIYNLGNPSVDDATIYFSGVACEKDITAEDIDKYIQPAVEKGWKFETNIEIPLVRTDFSWYMKNMYPEAYQDLTSAPEVDIANAKYTDHMYEGCVSMTTIPNELDMSNVIHAYGMFKGCSKLENLKFKDGSIHCTLNLSYTNISKETVLDILQNDLGRPVDNTCQIIFSYDVYDLTKDEYKQYVVPAIEKGWKIAGISEPEELMTNFEDYMKLTYPDTYQEMQFVTKLPETKAATTMARMFKDSTSLILISAEINSSKVKKFSSMFENCTSLTACPMLDTSNATTFYHMFANCGNLTYIPMEMDFTNITEEHCCDMFDGCYQLQILTIKPGTLSCNLDLSETNLDPNCVVSIIKGLKQLPVSINRTIQFRRTSIPPESMKYVEEAIVKGWTILGVDEDTGVDLIEDFTEYMRRTYPRDFVFMTNCPEIDTTNARIMRQMFEGCVELRNVVPLNTGNVKDMYAMFSGCRNLTKIYEMDMSNAIKTDLMFANCTSLKEISFKPGSLHTSVSFSDSPLTIDTIYNLLDNLPEVEDNPTIEFYPKEIEIEAYNAHVQPAIDKGWNIVGLNRALRKDFTDYMSKYFTDTYQMMTTINNFESTAEAIWMTRCFKGCEKLAVSPSMITNKVVDTESMFEGCTNLVGIQVLSMTNVTNTHRMLAGCVNLQNIAFTPGSLKVSLDFSDSPLTRQVILGIIKGLSTTPEVGATLTFRNTKITQDEWELYVVQAQNNGWVINGLDIYDVDPGDEGNPETSTGLKVYAVNVITDPDHQFISEAQKQAYREEMDANKAFDTSEASDQDKIEDTLEWKTIPSSSESSTKEENKQ